MSDQSAILKLARSNLNSSIYAIGVNDKYDITINDQQAKALTLVWALKEGRKIKKNMNIAIVGAGFSGLTAAVAIATNIKCKVTVYEKNDEVLSLVSKSRWRWVVPFSTYLDSFYYTEKTNFPFLNWSADYGWKVARLVRRKWDIYSLNFNIKTYLNTHVTMPQSSSGRPYIVVNNKRKVYDLIILATGFGQEKFLSEEEYPTYWQSGDPLNYRKNQFENTKIFISGVGDGGLIESFHYCFKEFYHDEIVEKYYDPRLVGFELRAFMHSLNILYNEWDELSLIEKQGRQGVDVKKRYNIFFSSIPRMEGAKGYLKYLKSNLSKEFEVVLNGLSESPFDIENRANPYNLILFSCLLKLKAVSYVSGKVNLKKKVLINSSLKKFKLDKYFIIARHGANNDFDTDFPDFKFKNEVNHFNERHGWKRLSRDEEYLKKYFWNKNVDRLIYDLIPEEMSGFEGAKMFLSVKKSEK